MTGESEGPRRRRVLKVLGASAIATGVAGCGGDSGSDDGSDDDSTPESNDDGPADTDDSPDDTDSTDDSDDDSDDSDRPDPMGATAWPMGGFDGGWTQRHEEVPALESEMTQSWRVQKDLEFSPGSRYFPLVAGMDTLVTATPQGMVYAFDEEDGTESWTFEMPERGSFDGGVALYDGVVYTNSRDSGADNTKYALDVETGDIIWEHKAGYGIDPLVDGERLYGQERDEVVARDIEDGTELWRKERVAGGTNIAVSDGRVVTRRDRTDGNWEIVALDATSGDELWTSESFAPDQTDFGTYVSAADGAVYATNDAGVVISIDAASGSTNWRASPYTENESFSSSITPKQPPVIGADHVFIGGSYVHALDQSSGQEVWSDGEQAGMRDRIGIVGGDVFTMAPPGIVGYDPATGGQRWTVDVDIRPSCINDFAVTDNGIYLSTIDCGGDDPEIIALGYPEDSSD